MNDENFVCGIAPFHIFLEYGVRRAVCDFVVAHREESVAFVYHDDVIVLIDNLQPPVVKYAEFAGEVDFHFVAWLERGVELCERGAVHSYLIVLKQFFNRSAFALGH